MRVLQSRRRTIRIIHRSNHVRVDWAETLVKPIIMVIDHHRVMQLLDGKLMAVTQDLGP